MMRRHRRPAPGQSRPEGLHPERVPVHEVEPPEAGRWRRSDEQRPAPAAAPVEAATPKPAPPPSAALPSEPIRTTRELELRTQLEATTRRACIAEQQLAEMTADRDRLDRANGRLVARLRAARQMLASAGFSPEAIAELNRADTVALGREAAS